MSEELINRLKNLATLDVKNGESYLNVTAEATAAIREIAQEAADAIEELRQTVEHYKGCTDAWYREACDYKAMIPHWIPTKKQYPFAEYGEGKSVLTIDCMGAERVLYFDGSNWCWPTGEPLTTARQFPITHWMPTPQPPTECRQMVTDSNQPTEVLTNE